LKPFEPGQGDASDEERSNCPGGEIPKVRDYMQDLQILKTRGPDKNGFEKYVRALVGDEHSEASADRKRSYKKRTKTLR